MSGDKAKRRPGFPWVLAVLGSLLLVIGFVSLLQLPEAATTDAALEKPPVVEFVKLEAAAAHPALQDEALLRNPEPLFLPTVVNAGQVGALSDDERNEPVAAFQNFPWEPVFAERDPTVNFPPVIELPAGPIAALQLESSRDAFDDMGRRDVEIPSLPARLGHMEVARASDGTVQLEMELPEVEGVPAGDWAPLELLAAVDITGLIGQPVVMKSSGLGPLDEWMVTHLARNIKLGYRLDPGIYHISIGP